MRSLVLPGLPADVTFQINSSSITFQPALGAFSTTLSTLFASLPAAMAPLVVLRNLLGTARLLSLRAWVIF